MSGSYNIDFDFRAPPCTLTVAWSHLDHPQSTHRRLIDSHPFNHAVRRAADLQALRCRESTGIRHPLFYPVPAARDPSAELRCRA